MTTPARHLTPAPAPGQDTDPVLAALRAARARRDQADRDIRILLAYARELATPRPYRLADLAQATGMSISGIRTAYTQRDLRIARYLVTYISRVQNADGRLRDGSHDLRRPSRRPPVQRQ